MQKTVNIRLNVDEYFIPKAKYIFDLLMKILGLKAKYYTKDTLDDIHIYYGVKTEENIPVKIYRNIITSLEFHKKIQMDRVNFVRYKNDYIPFLFSPVGRIFNPFNAGIIIRKDIISSAFYLVTGWEEYIGVTDTLAKTEDFTHLPLLSIYADIIKNAMMQTVLKQIIGINSSIESYYHLSLIFDKKLSKVGSDTNERFKEIQKIEHYQRKFLGNRKQYHISLISNEDTYAKIFNKVVKFYEEYQICKIGDCKINSDKLFITNKDKTTDYQKLYRDLSLNNVNVAITNYYTDSIGYKSFYSFPYHPFDFENNKTFEFVIIPVVLISSFYKNNCDKYNKLLEFETERFFKISLKYNSNIYLMFDILDFFYNCPDKFKLFKKIKQCFGKVRKTNMKPIDLGKIVEI